METAMDATVPRGWPGAMIDNWYSSNHDIHELNRAEEKLRQSEADLRTIFDTIRQGIVVLAPDGTTLYANRMVLDVTGLTLDEAKEQGFFRRAFLADDFDRFQIERQEGFSRGDPFDLEMRARLKSGEYRWVLCQYNPLKDESGRVIRWYVTATDIDDRKRAEEELKLSEKFLAEGQRLSQTGSLSWRVATGEITWSKQLYRIFEFDEHLPVTLEQIGSRVYPDDLPLLVDMFEKAQNGVCKFEYQHRLLMPDQSVKYIHLFARATRDQNGQLEYIGAAQDVTDLHITTDAIANPVVVLTAHGATLYANRVALNELRLSPGEAKKEGFFSGACHPEDLDRARDERHVALEHGNPFDLEMRLLRNGEYRWQLVQYNPLKDESGNIIRWYATATDVDDRKRTEEQLRKENAKLAQERTYLEEQIRSEMGFEQIIGNSQALKHVLELVETVAPSDSTVLLLGETGTGKELIARAVHERSRRKAKTFVKLNCAAIPTGLLESELFGHEKGAFTGAIIQKVGRMELADQGTLFLDEVGDIPIDIQPKLLRALQEREFERLGSTHTRKVNLRLVAATNCNLEKMIADREFRSDLFYRLNVFPIRVPPLRERKEDIPLLVAYFVQKFAKQMQKRIACIPAATTKALTAWEWPGNIRELENFIERAVIMTRGESLAAPLAELRKVTTDEPVRESALRGEHDIARIVKETIASLKDKSPENEHAKRQHEEIVRILTECRGRVGGPDGAAARMGLSRTTLISRMKKLGINPYGYAGTSWAN